LQYRKEIDGLRAIAIIPVIFFHAGFQWVSGGYIGVDIFFVISGYLITSIILDEKSRDQFSIINFYERRARRIIPALSVVLFFTTLAAFIFMPAGLLEEYSRSLFSVATFSSNVFFYMTSGYFSTVSDEKPLLHTWSLAVEEQYYIFFPVMISSLWFLGKQKLLKLLVSLSIISLAFSQYLSVRGSVDANFYLIFSRAWELFFGSMIAFFSLQAIVLVRWKRELLGILGILMIFYSIVFFDEKTPFPSFYTLVPILGTCAIIIFSNQQTIVGRFLSNKLFVAIGLISYSLYLWHQPLFAFLRLKTIGEPSDTLFIAGIFLTVLFSLFSYQFVEKPFRNKIVFTRKSIFKFSALSLFIFILIGLVGYYYKGFENNIKYNRYTKTIESSPKRKECHTKGEGYIKPVNACRYFGENITWASFGDSHTVELAYALAKRLEPKGEGLLHLSFSGCPPALLFDVKRLGCSNWINESLEYLEKNDAIKHVFLGFRYSAFIYGDQLKAYPEVPEINPAHKFTDSFRDLSAGELREVYWKSLSEIISRLLSSGKEVYLLYPVPELPMNIAKAVTPFSVFNQKTMFDLQKITTAGYYFKRNKFILDKLDTLAYGDQLHAVKPFDILCSINNCPAIIQGKSLYFDDDHLSISGAKMIIEQGWSNFRPSKTHLKGVRNTNIMED